MLFNQEARSAVFLGRVVKCIGKKVVDFYKIGFESCRKQGLEDPRDYYIFKGGEK